MTCGAIVDGRRAFLFGPCDCCNSLNIFRFGRIAEKICWFGGEDRFRGVNLAVNLQETELRSGEGLGIGTKHTSSTAPVADDSLDRLCRALFAQITDCVINHDTEDWPSYYDKLCATVCRVVAQSDLGSDTKSLLTRRLIEHVVELQRWWPRLRAS